MATLFFRLWPLALVFALSFGALHLRAQTGTPGAGPAPGPSAFVGSDRCADCHRQEHAAWTGTQHALALQQATGAVVLGNFDGATFEKDGVRTAFLTRDGRYLIDTPGPDGKRGLFEVRFTLGLEPLQQYLVELPGGRLQAFGLAWDSRPARDGGQRWFDLYPDQKLALGDALHWTGIQQTANFMCIDCHVTNFRKGFDAAANGYRSTWSEAGVGCESCHGPGERHVADPKTKLPARFPPRAGIAWGTDPAKRPQVDAAARNAEVAVCARCHARRSQLTDDIHAGQPFGDGFHANLLESSLYRADGQMLDEVFNYGSFLQSRMHAMGVSCSDCHDPHTAKLKARGNALCEQCHAAAKYESRDHHFHEPGSKAGECVSCHMPAVTFMGVDPRHDHGFRVPRPDLAAALGGPDACTTCHTDQPAGWAARELQRRLGRPPTGLQNFAAAFSAADQGAPGAADLLAGIANDPTQPGIVRASAIARAGPGGRGIDLAAAFGDPDPLVRRSAVQAAADDRDGRWTEATVRLLSDPVRDVRIEAARALAGPAELRLSEGQREAFRRALAEYQAVQRFNEDRAEAHMNLALLQIRRGNGLLADDHLARAIAVDPTFVPAWLQLAELYRLRRDETKARETLRRGVNRNPEAAALHHALGLALVRERRVPEALVELRRAADLEPTVARYGYVYALALEQTGQAEDGLRTIEMVLQRHPYDAESLVAAASWSLRRGDNRRALERLLVLQSLRPDDRALAREIERVRRMTPD